MPARLRGSSSKEDQQARDARSKGDESVTLNVLATAMAARNSEKGAQTGARGVFAYGFGLRGGAFHCGG